MFKKVSLIILMFSLGTNIIYAMEFMPEEAEYKIAILGWGSLICSPRNLAASRFIQNGPELPIQFSRISSDGRLTLVKDLDFGIDVKTWFARSNFSNLSDAIENLRAREGTIRKYIGYIDLKNKTFSVTQIKRGGKSKASDVEHITGKINRFGNTPDKVDIVGGSGIRKEFVQGKSYLKKLIAWAYNNGFTAVIWTDLPSNFYEKRNEDWSLNNAIKYLQTITNPEQKQIVRNYIEKTPRNVYEALGGNILKNALN